MNVSFRNIILYFIGHLRIFFIIIIIKKVRNISTKIFEEFREVLKINFATILEKCERLIFWKNKKKFEDFRELLKNLF